MKKADKKMEMVLPYSTWNVDGIDDQESSRIPVYVECVELEDLIIEIACFNIVSPSHSCTSV